MSTISNLLIRHGYIPNGYIPNISFNEVSNKDIVSNVAAITLAVNLSYYGFGLNAESAQELFKCRNLSSLFSWWEDLEVELRDITGENRNIGDFVVYKNFPREVLEKTEAEYWFNQILMYWGLPNDLFTKIPEVREELKEKPQLKILHLEKEATKQFLLDSYLNSTSKWKKVEFKDVVTLIDHGCKVNLSKVSFKENLINLISLFIKEGKKIYLSTATDVLRLGAELSNGDISLREKLKFKSFSRSTRQFLLSNLEIVSNLEEDLARRPEIWKRFLYALHPFDYKNKYSKVAQTADLLYRDKLRTFNSLVEERLNNLDEEALNLLQSRPGEFRRRLVHCLSLFGSSATDAFIEEKVLKRLTTKQLIFLRSVLEVATLRDTRVFPPKGNWNKLQITENTIHLDDLEISRLITALTLEISSRVPKIKELDPLTKLVKLSSNDGEIPQYTRGTELIIPDNITFIRTASYWSKKSHCNVWFDNGWNFFNANWENQGTCCWNSVEPFDRPAAIFSGDPTNSKDMKGRAAQLIDLYIDNLLKLGIRYGVWSILAYSHIAFEEADEVFAALQWGEEPKKGKLFEPSRCQLAFPLKGKQYTKYICYLDFEKRRLVYTDVNFKGSVQSATENALALEKIMPAFCEYLDSIPSVYDVFKNSVDSENGDGYVLYSDKDRKLEDKAKAYIFKKENKESSIQEINFNSILSK